MHGECLPELSSLSSLLSSVQGSMRMDIDRSGEVVMLDIAIPIRSVQVLLPPTTTNPITSTMPVMPIVPMTQQSEDEKVFAMPPLLPTSSLTVFVSPRPGGIQSPQQQLNSLLPSPRKDSSKPHNADGSSVTDDESDGLVLLLGDDDAHHSYHLSTHNLSIHNDADATTKDDTFLEFRCYVPTSIKRDHSPSKRSDCVDQSASSPMKMIHTIRDSGKSIISYCKHVINRIVSSYNYTPCMSNSPTTCITSNSPMKKSNVYAPSPCNTSSPHSISSNVSNSSFTKSFHKKYNNALIVPVDIDIE